MTDIGGVIDQYLLLGRSIKVKGHARPDLDSIASGMLLEMYLREKGCEASFIIPDTPNEHAIKVLTELGIDIDLYRGDINNCDDIILVDHHDHIGKGNVIGYIDHHPDSREYKGINGINLPVGSCAVMILRYLEKEGIALTSFHYELALLSLYTDTRALRTSRTTGSEREWARTVLSKYGFDEEKIKRMSIALTDLSLPVEILSMNDYKLIEVNGRRINTTQLIADNVEPQGLSALVSYMSTCIRRGDAYMWMLSISVPRLNMTRVLRIYGDSVLSDKYDRLLSRAKDIMPMIENELAQN